MSSGTLRPPFRKSVKVRQACDCCRARKVRCDGASPCANCTSATFECTYLAVHKKTGPKGRRRVSTQPRYAVRPAVPVINLPPELPAASRPDSEPDSVASASPEPEQLLEDQAGHRYAQLGPHTAGTPVDARLLGGHHGICTNLRDPFGFQPSPLVSTELVALCLDAFFTHKYPITPILDRRQMEAALPHLAALPELYALLTACCAVMVLSPEILESSSPSSPSPSPSSPSAASISTSTSTSTSTSPAPPALPSAEFLISETTRARRFCNYIESPSLTTVQTSFFLFSAFFCLGRDNSAWFYIREAITMLQLLRLHEEDTYASIAPDQAAFSRRLFWVLFITERAYALQRHRLLTLQRTLALPAVDPAGPEAHILSGFLDLISLFQHFDNDFLALWNLPLATPPPAGTPPPEPLTRLQSVLARRGPPPGHCAESQQADLVVSRQWLKTMVWQLCVSKTPLPSSSRSRSRTADDSMTLHYPVTIAREVVAAARDLPRGALEANGVGIVEKVFDIGCSLADVLALAPRAAPPEALAVGPRDCLVEIVRIVGNTVRGGGESRHLRVLVAKASECLRVGVDRGVAVVGAGAGWGSREGGREVYELCGDGDGDDTAEGDAEAMCEMSGNDGLDDHYLLSEYQGDWGEEGEGVSDEGTEFFLPYP